MHHGPAKGTGQRRIISPGFSFSLSSNIFFFFSGMEEAF